jgi:hypothetical protein
MFVQRISAIGNLPEILALLWGQHYKDPNAQAL